MRVLATTTMHHRPMQHANHVPSRIRSLWQLRRWSAGFSGHFPPASDLAAHPHYWNEKIPVCSSLIEGDSARADVQRECAQLLLDACTHLIRAKPAGRDDIRVTCCITLPDMFSSEICIYVDEEYFMGHVTAGKDGSGEIRTIRERSLARDWQLILPAGVLERGVHLDYPETTTHHGLTGDRWFYGEVA